MVQKIKEQIVMTEWPQLSEWFSGWNTTYNFVIGWGRCFQMKWKISILDLEEPANVLIFKLQKTASIGMGPGKR